MKVLKVLWAFSTLLSILALAAGAETAPNASLGQDQDKKEVGLLAQIIIDRTNRITICQLQRKSECFRQDDISAFRRYIPIVQEMYSANPSLITNPLYKNLIGALKQIMKDSPSEPVRASAQSALSTLETTGKSQGLPQEPSTVGP